MNAVKLLKFVTLFALGAAAWPAAADVPVIRVGWTIPGEEAKYWMQQRPEAFPDLGKKYRIEWTQFQGTAPMVQAMLSKALDCSSQAPLSLAQGAVNGGLEAYVVAQHVGESPDSFSVYWAVKDDSPIKSVADLKGKLVGTNVYGSGVYGGMAAILKRQGLDASTDIKLVETGFPGSEAAIRGGRVDAGVFVQPFAARAEAKGGLRKLFSLQDLMPNTAHAIEVCSKAFADANPELARMYVRDLTKAMEMALANPADTIEIVAATTRAPAEVLQSYLLKENDFARRPDATPDFDAYQAMFDIYTEMGLLSKPVKAADFRRDDITAPVR